MVRKILILFALLFSLILEAQIKIKGKVVDKEGPVFAANIYFTSHPLQGVTSNMDGLFALDFYSENDTLVISYIGYKEIQFPSKLLLKNERNVFTLESTDEVLREIVITSRDPISEKFSVVKLEKMDIYLNPVAQGDPLKAITILPASTITDETANPSLRGSDPDRSRVVLNGVPIYNPVRASQINNQGFFSLFNPELIDKQYVYASNPPLTYGNSSAGLVEIQTTKALEKNQLKLSATLVSAGFLVSQQLDSVASFMQVYGNYQLSDAFVGIQRENLPNLKRFNTLDFGANFRISLRKNWFLNSYTYGIDESFEGIEEQFTYRGEFESSKTRVFTVNSIEHAFEQGYLSFNTGFNSEEQKFVFGNNISDQETQQLYLGLNYKVQLNDIDLQTVLSWDYQSNAFDDTSAEIFYALSPDSPTIASQNIIENSALEVGFYGSWEPNQKLIFSSGMRTNIPTHNQSSFLSWQLGVKYQMDLKHSLLLSGGRYYNYRTPSFFQQRFDLLTSDQIALDYSFNGKKTSITSALYYKKEGGAQPIIGGLVIDEQETYGIELFLKQQLHEYLSWSASYSYIDQSFQLGDLRFPGSRDADYFVKSTLEFNHPKWFTLSLNWIARTGTNYTGIIDGEEDTTVDFFRPIFSDQLLGDRFNNYNRLDMNMSKYIRWNKKELVVFFSINNVLNQRNQRSDIYTADYSVRSFEDFQLRLFFVGVVWDLNY